MEDWIVGISMVIGERFVGPMSFRLLFQPAMAVFLAVRAGLHDAREGKPPYLFAVVTDNFARAELLREGWKSIARIFFLAVIMDVIYQLIVNRWVYLLEVLFISILLAIVPYVLVRGPVNRIARRLLPKSEVMAAKVNGSK
jgi:hypothetical protein